MMNYVVQKTNPIANGLTLVANIVVSTARINTTSGALSLESVKMSATAAEMATKLVSAKADMMLTPNATLRMGKSVVRTTGVMVLATESA